MSIEPDKLKQIVEGALLASGQPLDIKRLLELFDVDEPLLDDDNTITKDDIQSALEAIVEDCQGRGFELKQVGSGWRFQVRENTAPWVNRLWEEKPQKYSRAMLETLALIAYRQPITRGDIEEIRGVAVSSHIIKTLSEREWVKVVGHRDVPGRPSLYATTRTFLDYFNLTSLEELPSLGELADLEELNAELNLDQAPPEVSPGQTESAVTDEATVDTNSTSGEPNDSSAIEQDATELDYSPESAELGEGLVSVDIEAAANAENSQDQPISTIELEQSENTDLGIDQHVSEDSLIDSDPDTEVQNPEEESPTDDVDAIDSSRSLFDRS